MEHTYLRYECGDTFGLTVAAPSSQAPASTDSLAWLVGATSSTTSPTLLTVAGSLVTGWNLKTVSMTLKMGHAEQLSGGVGTGRAVNSDEMVCLAACRDCQLVATGWVNGSVRIFTVPKQRRGYNTPLSHSLLDEQDRDNTFLQAEPLVLQGHGSAVRALAWHENTRLASAANDGAIVIWDVVAESGLYRLRGHRGPITQIDPMKGLFILPAALASKPDSSSSGLFAPTPTASSSNSSSSTLPKTVAPLGSKCISLGGKGSSLSSMFQPLGMNPAVPPSRSSGEARSSSVGSSSLTGLFSTQPASAVPSQISGLFAPPAQAGAMLPPKNAPGLQPGQPKFSPGLFIPPKKSIHNPAPSLAISAAPATSRPGAMSVSGGLFTPPKTPKPSPARSEDSLVKHPSEPCPRAPPNTSEMNKTGYGLFVPSKNPDLDPPQSPSRNPTAGLESLFRPPGSSPGASPQTANRPTVHRRNSSQNATTIGRLDRINLSGTSVTPQALLDSFQRASAKVSLTSFKCTGTRKKWSEDEVRELTEVVSFSKLRLLDLEYQGPLVAEFVAHYSSARLQGRE